MSTHAELRLGGEPDAPARARAFVEQHLPTVSEDVLSDALLAVTELVTNAQLHGRPPVVVTVEAVGEGARVEVRDHGRDLLVIPTQSPEAMTGRGLAMVAVVSRAWGVEPVPGGKAVWALLQPGSTEDKQAPQLDLDSLLAAWEDDESFEPLHAVRLGAVPTSLLLEAKRHIDNIVRELTLERAGATSPLAPELERLIDVVLHDFTAARTAIKEQAAAAAAGGHRQTDLVLHLPVSSVAAGERYLGALDEADRYARAARLLTLETPPLHKLFRRWYVTALIDQLREVTQGRTPPEPVPFVQVLLDEVGELSSLRESAHRLDLLQRINARVRVAETAQDVAQAVVSTATQDLGAVSARVYVHSGDVLRSLIQHTDALRGGFEAIGLDDDLPGAEAFRTGQPLLLRNLAQLVERYPQLAGAYPTDRAMHVVPLQAGRHRLGVLVLSFPTSSRYGERDQDDYVRALADVLAQGLERVQATDRLSVVARTGDIEAARPSGQVWVGGAQEQRLKSLADAAGAIAGARSVEMLLEVVTEAARSIVGAHQGVATRLYGTSWDGATTYVSLSDQYADWRSYDNVPRGLGVLNAVTRENTALRLTREQLQQHPEFRGLRDAPGHPPLPDYLAAPFTSRDGENIGLLQLSHKTDESEFDEQDEAIAVQLALMASSALEHVELVAELEASNARLRDEQEFVTALHDVGQAVTSHLEHAEVVQTVTDAATTMTGAEFGAFFYNVLDESGESYSLYTISGVPREAFSRFPMPRNTDVFGPTFNGEGVVRLDDVAQDPRYGRNAPYHGMPEGHLPVRSYLAVPVQDSSGGVLGGLFFGHATPGVFDEAAERLAVGLAGYAAIALENGRLYDAARRESRAKEEVAAALEQPLAPPDLPEVPGVELAAVYTALGGVGRLGGDFYDLVPVGTNRWLLAVGDVSGKGPEAAAVTGLVRYTLWGAAHLSDDPLAVADALNAALLRHRSDRFATLVLAVLEPHDAGVHVEAVWAGHPAGVRLGADGTHLVAGDGMPLGLFEEPGLCRVHLDLAPGETLLLHTDGLVERQGAVLDDATLVRLAQETSGQPLPGLLKDLTTGIDAMHPPRDDVAVVAVRPRASAS